ncbi:DUF6228 family protein [Streptomyces sp. AM 2-1-1]|uniref:DUF6228 family protein n=1 Tax=Streptomyces sp. AM 2-1-1 TaxID=3028709 RepID=UPI0023B9F304|nr:DUF6228 family protein [Streptomyces sp. AM 2-1-1]WEH38267.1 DUF6228 family protein [Streptomyces sp. AM 2-1-1]
MTVGAFAGLAERKTSVSLSRPRRTIMIPGGLAARLAAVDMKRLGIQPYGLYRGGVIEDGRVVRVGDSGPRPVHLLFSEQARPFGDDPVLDFLVKARGRRVSVETQVRTWDGDGLDAFLSSLADGFRGWEGVRAWRSLEHDLTVSAEHHSGGYVHLTWGVHGRPPAGEWHFETITVHAAGEEMRNLAADFHSFLTSVVA